MFDQGEASTRNSHQMGCRQASAIFKELISDAPTLPCAESNFGADLGSFELISFYTEMMQKLEVDILKENMR